MLFSKSQNDNKTKRFLRFIVSNLFKSMTLIGRQNVVPDEYLELLFILLD